MRVAKGFVATGFMFGLLLRSSGAGAQIVRGEIAIGGGLATDSRGLSSNAATITPSVLYAPDARFSASGSLSGTQFGSSEHAIGGSASLGTRLPIGSIFALAASASGSGLQTSFNSSYSSIDLTPTLEATISVVTLYTGAHVASGSTSLQIATSSPAGIFGAPAPGTHDSSFSRTGAGAVFGGIANIAGDNPTEASSLGYHEEHARLQGIMVIDRVASGSYTNGSLTLSATAGYRDAIDEQLGFGSVSSGIAINDMLSLQGAAGSYPSNRVSGVPGGHFASVGVMIHASRRLDAPAVSAPRMRGVPEPPSGMTRLVISAPDARVVQLVGDWNNWTPIDAMRGNDGLWYSDVSLARGEYRYAFKIDGKRFAVPDGVVAVEDGFGGKSALVAVR